MKVVIVTGGRDFEGEGRFLLVERAIKEEGPDLVIMGDCPTGLDKLALRVCRWHEIDYLLCHAHWEVEGDIAGPNRNARMVLHAIQYKTIGHDVVGLSFPGDKGTKNCTNKMMQAKIHVTKIREV